MTWILTASGRHFNYLDPRAEDIDILDTCMGEVVSATCSVCGQPAFSMWEIW